MSKSFMLRQYLESKTVRALKWDAEFYSLPRSGNKAMLVQRLLDEDALLSAPTTPWASESVGVDERSVSGGSGQHPPGEIYADGSVAGVLQVPAQISGPAGQIQHGGTGR